jgi:hypothetical protein
VAISKAKGPQERTLNRLEREGVTILRVEDGFLYASHNYKILLSANGGDQWEIDGIISVRRWRKMVETFPFLNRTTRGGVFNVLPLPDGARLGVVSGWLVRAESHSTWYRPVLRLARGSRPLNLCMAPNGVIYFGEYFLNLRRSQPVNVVASRDGGKRWEVVYTFPQGSICHIHRIFHDPYDNALLVCTGDRDQEVGIYKTNDDFKTLESLAQGNQDCRTTALIPFRDYFLYGTDNPNGANFIMALDRRTRKVEKLQEVPGPVLYGCQVGGKAAFSTMQENKKHQVTVWVGSGRDFRQVAWFQTNNSTRLWRELVGYSTVVLPEGRQEGPFLYCTPLGDLTHSNTLMRIPL